MKRFKNILYVMEKTADLSPSLARAASLAKDNQASLTLLEVIPPVPENQWVDLMAVASHDLQVMIAPYLNSLEVRTDVRMGATFLEVIRSVLRNGHDLVIKVAENPGFLQRLFGSDDMHLLRKCPCPLWLMKPAGKPRYSCILAAVDFDPRYSRTLETPLNRQILTLASSVALYNKASLHLVHAWEAFAEKSLRASSDISSKSVIDHVQNEQIIHQKGLYRLGEALREWIGSEAYNSLSPLFHLPKGSARERIVALAEELQADLVVMGTVARSGIAGFIIGNTAESILNHLGCAVFAVKPPKFKSPVKLARKS